MKVWKEIAPLLPSCILSSLAGVPIKQSMAVTGSVNQEGEIQPIGGVNHKIEGFYAEEKKEARN